MSYGDSCEVNTEGVGNGVCAAFVTGASIGKLQQMYLAVHEEKYLAAFALWLA